MIKLIVHELKEHIPFTALGALTGIIVMVIVVLTNVPSNVSNTIFYTLHPLHHKCVAALRPIADHGQAAAGDVLPLQDFGHNEPPRAFHACGQHVPTPQRRHEVRYLYNRLYRVCQHFQASVILAPHPVIT